MRGGDRLGAAIAACQGAGLRHLPVDEHRVARVVVLAGAMCMGVNAGDDGSDVDGRHTRVLLGSNADWRVLMLVLVRAVGGGSLRDDRPGRVHAASNAVRNSGSPIRSEERRVGKEGRSWRSP